VGCTYLLVVLERIFVPIDAADNATHVAGPDQLVGCAKARDARPTSQHRHYVLSDCKRRDGQTVATETLVRGERHVTKYAFDRPRYF
jgi:hypothetical protein